MIKALHHRDDVDRLCVSRKEGGGGLPALKIVLMFGYIILPHVDWPVQCLAQRKSQKKYTKRKDRNR